MARAVFFIISLSIMALTVSSSRADYLGAAAAYKAGNYDEAYRRLTALDVERNPRATKLLSDMKRLGRGVAKNEVEAYKLLSMVYITGDDDQRGEAIRIHELPLVALLGGTAAS